MGDTNWGNLRHGLRLMLRNPGFTAVAVITIALGVGVNTAVFSVVNELLLRPRPGIGAPDRLVDMGSTENGSGFDNLSYLNYLDYRDRNVVFDGLAAYEFLPHPVALTSGSGARRAYAKMVSGNFFDVLRVQSAAGRFFLPNEDRTPGTHPVIVLSHDFWSSHFASDPAIVGRTVALNGQGFTVVGVADERFGGTGIAAPDLWLPLNTQPLIHPEQDYLSRREANWLQAIGRLDDDVSLETAQAALDLESARLFEEHPAINRHKGVGLTPSGAAPAGARRAIAGFMTLLMVVVGLVLLVASINVCGMLLSRALRRKREIAVRLSLGATRGRLIRQLLVETSLLFAIGGVAGVALAAWITTVLPALLPSLPFPIQLQLALDWRVVTFGIALPMALGALTSLAPALHATRVDLVPDLKAESAGGVGGAVCLRSALVVAQVALSLVLLIAAGVLVRGLQDLGRTDPGFDPTGVTVASLDLSMVGHDDASGPRFVETLLERVRALPAVVAADAAADLPLDGVAIGLGGVTTRGREPAEGGSFAADWNMVGTDYFNTMDIPVLAGRAFELRDRADAPAVAIVNETLAHRFWPGKSAVGKTLFNGPVGSSPTLEVVGVVADGKYRQLWEPTPLFVYVPLAQRFRPQLSLLVRTAGRGQTIPALRATVRELDPNLPLVRARGLTDSMAANLFPLRFAGTATAALGLVALLLSALGIWGVTAYSVDGRTREIGLRLALGARLGDVLRMVIGRSMAMVGLGALLGLLGAVTVARLIASLLAGTRSADPVAWIAVGALLSGVALLASWLPARRAARIDPLTALRHD